MDLLSILEGVGKTMGKMQNQYESKAKNFLRGRSNQEILKLYKSGNKNNPEYRYVVEEAQRRNLI